MLNRCSSFSFPRAIAMAGLLVAVVVAASAGAHAELAPAPAGTFTIAVLPDTQQYKGKGTKAEPESEAPVSNALFDSYTSWIAENLEAQRIAFVSHVGDVVDRDVPDQWIVARKAMR